MEGKRLKEAGKVYREVKKEEWKDVVLSTGKLNIFFPF